MKLFSLFFTLLTFNTFVFSQISSIQQQYEQYNNYAIPTDSGWDSLSILQGQPTVGAMPMNKSGCSLNKKVFGFHPTWSGTAYQNYDWTLLSDYSYFSYDVSASTGQNNNGNFIWASHGGITQAQANNVNTGFSVVLFQSHTTFFNSTTAKQNLITNIISLLQQRNAKHVCIDFEGMNSTHRLAFTNFIHSLRTSLDAALPGIEIYLAIPSKEWSYTFDVSALNSDVNYYILMGYDYYYSGSGYAGPTDPLYQKRSSDNDLYITASINTWLNNGIANSKLLLAVAYYGRSWKTNGSTVNAPTLGSSSSLLCKDMENNTQGYYSNPIWDSQSNSWRYSYIKNGADYQAYCNKPNTLEERYDIVNNYNLAGIAIWALGYDNGYTTYWEAIREKLTSCQEADCTDTIYDMGGANGVYTGQDDYTITVRSASQTGQRIAIKFNQLDIESPLNGTVYDYILLYDGATTSAALLHDTIYGTTLPPTLYTTSNVFTLKFHSDLSIEKEGFALVWKCEDGGTILTQDTQIPTTDFNLHNNPNWITQNTLIEFQDEDNQGVNNIEKKYLLIANHTGITWKANNDNGFYYTDFTQIADWQSPVGTWSLQSNDMYTQSDESISNTNAYTAVNQSNSKEYLYHFRIKTEGSSSTKRFGIHLMATNPTAANRGNGYFVWLRESQQKVEFYKVRNDTLLLVQTFTNIVSGGNWKDYKVSYNRQTGELRLFIDNLFIGNWVDANPYTTGQYVSFRTGNCKVNIDFLHIYKNRTAAYYASVGDAALNDIRYPTSYGSSILPAKVKSVVMDFSRNVSTIVTKDYQVDYTAPDSTISLIDGLYIDIDTQNYTTSFTASWQPSNEPNSGIKEYWVGLGSTPNTVDIVDWQPAGNTATSITFNNLNLQLGARYYFRIQVENNAGLATNEMHSDGVLINATENNPTSSISDSKTTMAQIFVNNNTLQVLPNQSNKFTILVTDIAGKEINNSTLFLEEKSTHTISMPTLAIGYYIITIRTNTASQSYKYYKY